MCAKVLNSTLGQLSGKLGGMVFSRNAGGAYVRAGVKGINPSTIAQVQARNAFGSVSTLFRGLTSAEKTQWQEFADNYYSPRSGGNVGQFSAYNAFIALRSTVQQSLRLASVGVITVNSPAVTVTQDNEGFTPMPESPLALTLLPGISNGFGDSLLLTLTSAVIKSNASGSVTMQVGDGLGVQVPGNFDINGNMLGYAIYISNGNPSDNMSYNNELAKCLGFITPWTSIEAGSELNALKTITAAFPANDTIGRYKRFPLIDEYCLVTVFVMNKYGMFSKLGTIETQVVAP